MTLKKTKAADKSQEKKIVNLRYMRDKDREKVRGIFRFYEVPGGTMTFSFKAYKEDPVETFTMTDGQTYTIPLGVAKHLANNLWYPVHEFLRDENGNTSTHVRKKVHRAGFQSLEFIDLDEIDPCATADIVEVVTDAPNNLMF